MARHERRLNVSIRQVKSDDFITVGVDADMKLAPLAAIVDFEVEHSALLRGPA
jgi:hypothetical protein